MYIVICEDERNFAEELQNSIKISRVDIAKSHGLLYDSNTVTNESKGEPPCTLPMFWI